MKVFDLLKMFTSVIVFHFIFMESVLYDLIEIYINFNSLIKLLQCNQMKI